MMKKLMLRLPSITRHLFLAAVVLAALSPQCFAYSGDSHYYLRFAMALETCYTWDEAHLIASGDWMLDQNRTTVAEMHPFSKKNKINWHAFGHPEERFNELWVRVMSEPDLQSQLIKMGQFGHFLEDWESHAGYGQRMGHARATFVGNDPDSLGKSDPKNWRMTQQSLDHLLKLCVHLGRPVRGTNDPDRALVEIMTEINEDGILGALHAQSTPKWKRWGKKGKKGRKILSENREDIEKFVARRSEGKPERKIPMGFIPGDPDDGIPPPISIKYGKEGEILEVAGVEIELEPEFGGQDASDPDEEKGEIERIESWWKERGKSERGLKAPD